MAVNEQMNDHASKLVLKVKWESGNVLHKCVLEGILGSMSEI